jgi:hypothetical protein
MRLTSLRFALIVLGVAGVARGQYPASNQVGQIGQVDTRVNGELYGNMGNPDRYAVPQQMRLLPSEERYALWRSGALPSDIQMNRAAYGPLPPQGLINYIPRRSPLQEAMRMPAPQLYNPAYDPAMAGGRRPDQQQQQLPPPPGAFPQNAAEAVQATARIPGAVNDNAGPLQQPAPQRPQQVQQQQQRPGAQQAPPPSLRPQQLPPEQEQPTPAQRMIPGLTPVPDSPLPNDPLFQGIPYDPNATPGARWLSHTLNRIPVHDATLANPQPKRGQSGQQQPQEHQQEAQPPRQ